MEPSLSPPSSRFAGINSQIKLFLYFTREYNIYEHSGAAERWIQNVIDDIGLEGQYFVSYDFKNQEYIFRVIAEGAYTPDRVFSQQDNPANPEEEIVRSVNRHLEKFDIYDHKENSIIDIIDYEVVEVE